MLLSSGEITAPWGVPCSGYPFLGILQNALAKERLDQRKDAAIGHLGGHTGHQAVLRDRIEVAP